MNSQSKPKMKLRGLLVIILIFAVVIVTYFLIQAGKLNIGNSCTAVRNRYENAKEKEDYGEVSKYYQQMNELGCEF